MRWLGSFAVLVGLLLGGLSPASAQFPRPGVKGAKTPGILPQKQKGKEPGVALERLLQMSPADRERALRQLPPARRRLVLERLKRLELLSPEEIQVLRGRYQAFLDLEPDRQEAVRAEMRELRGLSRVERRRRLADEEIRKKFSEQELQLLYESAGKE